MVNFMWPEGVETLGGPSLGSHLLDCICLAFYDALFTFLVCFALELSILE